MGYAYVGSVKPWEADTRMVMVDKGQQFTMCVSHIPDTENNITEKRFLKGIKKPNAGLVTSNWIQGAEGDAHPSNFPVDSASGTTTET